MLGQAMLCLCEPLRKSTKTGLEVTLEGEVRRCFWRVLSFCCDFLEAGDMSPVCHEAGRYHPSGRCTTSFENTVHGRKRLSRLLTAKTETQGQVQGLKKVVRMVSERVERKGRSQEPAKIMRLLSQHHLTK